MLKIPPDDRDDDKNKSEITWREFKNLQCGMLFTTIKKNILYLKRAQFVNRKISYCLIVTWIITNFDVVFSLRDDDM